MTTASLALAASLLVNAALSITDARGVARQPLRADPGELAVVFLVTHDCPISNHFAREIHRTCDDYAAQGIRCSLVYTDRTLTDTAALNHARAYGHGDYAVIVDREHRLVRETAATITPEVIVVKSDKSIGYRGRIDDTFPSLGVRRRTAVTHDLRDALDALVSGRTPVSSQTQPVGCFISEAAPAADHADASAIGKSRRTSKPPSG